MGVREEEGLFRTDHGIADGGSPTNFPVIDAVVGLKPASSFVSQGNQNNGKVKNIDRKCRQVIEGILLFGIQHVVGTKALQPVVFVGRNFKGLVLIVRQGAQLTIRVLLKIINSIPAPC